MLLLFGGTALLEVPLGSCSGQSVFNSTSDFLSPWQFQRGVGDGHCRWIRVFFSCADLPLLKHSVEAIFSGSLRTLSPGSKRIFVELGGGATQTLRKPGGWLLFIHKVASSSATPGIAVYRLPCPSLSPRVCSDSCLLTQWCYPTISSSVVPFSFCLQSLSESGSFPVCQLFTSGGQRIGASGFSNSLSNGNSGLISFRVD